MRIRHIAVAGVSLLSLTAPAYAQDAAADEAGAEDIVVTGTLIRGTQVVGAQTISVSAQSIIDKGANSTNELLSLIPQISNTFNGRFEGDPRGFGAGISVNRPNLRNLPGYNRATGSVTLVLMDGMRFTPVGVNQATVDVDIIPASVLAGIDAVTDGGSSLYGADAVAGVLNFRTMRKFDGVKVDGNFGFGTRLKGFSQWDGSVTAGTSWSNGNAYISVSHAERDAILNGQVPWADGLVHNAAGVASFSGTQCINPVGSEVRFFKFGAGATNWTNNPAAPGAGRFPLGTACDQTSAATYLPKQVRTNVFAALSHELADNIDLRVTGYWTKRDITLYGYPAGGSTTDAVFAIPQADNPPPGTIRSVLGGTGFSYGANSAYVNRPSQVDFETWGITPEVTVKLGDNWQLRTTLHYGQSSNFQAFTGADNAKALAYIASGQLNPLNVAAASAAVINDITDFQQDQETKHRLFMFRSIADGKIFTLPAGDAKLAIGIEYQDNAVRTRLNAGKVGALAAKPFSRANANSKSAFAEISLPVSTFLDINGSLRYDDYSNFGSTTNPNIGASLKLSSGLKLFGHWNKSFNAPTALDDLAISTGRFACPFTATSRPNNSTGRDNGLGACALVLEGSSKGLIPQTAESWAFGFEANPMRGLRFGGEFYAIDFKNALGAIDSQRDSSYVARPDLFTFNRDLLANAAILSAYYASISNGAQLSGQQPLSNIALIADLRTTNLSSSKIEGVDFHVNYDTDTSFGNLNFGVNGNWQTKAARTTGGVNINDLGVEGPRLTASTFVGWNNNGISAKVTVNYSGKFLDAAVNNVNVIEKIDPFVMTNLNLGYDFGDSAGALSGLSMRLGVDNLFDVAPQKVRRSNTNNPTFRNWTLGRLIKLGFSKKF